jgi:hypothetical protein
LPGQLEDIVERTNLENDSDDKIQTAVIDIGVDALRQTKEIRKRTNTPI